MQHIKISQLNLIQAGSISNASDCKSEASQVAITLSIFVAAFSFFMAKKALEHHAPRYIYKSFMVFGFAGLLSTGLILQLKNREEMLRSEEPRLRGVCRTSNH